MGTIIAWAPNFAPEYWLFCNGQLLPIQQYTALYSLLGTTYGGDGTNNFALPDLRGRVPVGAGAAPGLTPRGLGQTGGVESITLGVTNLPVHDHLIPASSAGSETGTPGTDKRLGVAQTPQRTAINLYTTAAANTYIQPTAGAGGGQAHTNMQPFVALNYIICAVGLYPPHQ